MSAVNALIRSTKSPTATGFRLLILGSLAAALLLSCEPVLIAPTTGSMTVSMNDGISARTLLPNISMDVASYEISGAGPNGAGFSESTAQQSSTVTRLVPGTWTITVHALNAAGAPIGTGSSTTEVSVGETAALTVTVRPLTGQGTLTVNVTWDAAKVADPVVSAELIADSGTSQLLSLTETEPGVASVTKTDVATGYHTLIVQLKDGDFLAAGTVEVARIAKDATTTGTFAFTSLKGQDGDMTVIIDPDMDDPLTVTLTGALSEVATNASMPVSADVTGSSETVSYSWYLDGTPVGADSSSYNTPNTLPAGSYTLSVVATSADGNSGSTSHTFNVVAAYEPIPVQAAEFSLYWDPPTDATNIAHYNVYYRVHGTNSWSRLGTADATATPSYTVTSTDLAYGTYDFAVTSVDADGMESDLHCSLDPNADPNSGWYIDWQAP